jgi:hypothetical protein
MLTSHEKGLGVRCTGNKKLSTNPFSFFLSAKALKSDSYLPFLLVPLAFTFDSQSPSVSFAFLFTDSMSNPASSLYAFPTSSNSILPMTSLIFSNPSGARSCASCKTAEDLGISITLLS